MKRARRIGGEVSISEISKSERGSKCNCYCLECNEPLEAQLHNPNSDFIDRFKHKSGNECHMSWLHSTAQEIIQEKSHLYLQGNIKVGYHDPVEEYRFDNGMRADNFVKTNGRDLCIEIVVSNPPSDRKRHFYTDANFDSLQINLHKEKYPKETTRAQVEYAVINEISNKNWIFKLASNETHTDPFALLLVVVLGYFGITELSKYFRSRPKKRKTSRKNLGIFS